MVRPHPAADSLLGLENNDTSAAAWVRRAHCRPARPAPMTMTSVSMGLHPVAFKSGSGRHSEQLGFAAPFGAWSHVSGAENRTNRGPASNDRSDRTLEANPSCLRIRPAAKLNRPSAVLEIHEAVVARYGYECTGAVPSFQARDCRTLTAHPAPNTGRIAAPRTKTGRIAALA